MDRIIEFYKIRELKKCLFIIIEFHSCVVKSVRKIRVELKIDYVGNYLSLLRALLVE